MDIVLTLPERTPTLNQWQRMHWAKRRKLTERFAWLLVQSNRGTRPSVPIARCVVSVIRYAPSTLPDLDNLYGGVKPLLDCLVPCSALHPFGLGYVADDNQMCITRLDVEAVDTRKTGKASQTVVTVRPL